MSARNRLALAIALIVLGLPGCGSRGTAFQDSSRDAVLARSGANWHIMTESQKTDGDVFVIMGGLYSTGGSVTGKVQIWGSQCFYPDSVVSISGQNQQGKLYLAGTFFGQLVTVAAELNEGASTMTGRYTIQGGCADGDYGNLVGLRIPDVSGTWTGTMISAVTPGAERYKQITSMSLARAATERGDGWFNITGTATLSPSCCFTTADVKGAIIGRILVLELMNRSNSSEWFRIVVEANDLGTQAGEGAVPLTGWSLGGGPHYIFFGGACDSDEGIVALRKIS